MDDYEYLKQFAVGKQLEYIEAIIACGGNKTAASKMVGTNHRSNLRALETVKYKSASKTIIHGDAGTEQTDEGYSVKGTSRLYDEAGNLKIQWVKTDRDKAQQADEQVSISMNYLNEKVKQEGFD